MGVPRSYAAAFLAVAFLGAAAFFAGAFLVGFAAPEVVFCLLTRPELVFLRTVGTSTTAGAGVSVFLAVAFLVDGALLVAVLALGFAAVLVLGAAVFALVVLGAVFLAVVVFALVALGLVSVFSFYQ